MLGVECLEAKAAGQAGEGIQAVSDARALLKFVKVNDNEIAGQRPLGGLALQVVAVQAGERSCEVVQVFLEACPLPGPPAFIYLTSRLAGGLRDPKI